MARRRWIEDIRHGEIIGANVKVGDCRLSVHHYMGCGDLWFVSYYGIFDKKQMNSDTLSEAKREALKMLQDKLQTALDQTMMIIGGE